MIFVLYIEKNTPLSPPNLSGGLVCAKHYHFIQDNSEQLA